jgi:hypothetical protein
MIECLGNREAAGTQSRGARIVLLSLLLPFLAYYDALALDPDRTVHQFFHTGWTAAEGAPNGIEKIAQTSDGSLWLGTIRGLVRFDGVRFEDYQPPKGGKIPSGDVYSLLGTPGGGLWIGFLTGSAGDHTLVDRDGGMWMLSSEGVARIASPGRLTEKTLLPTSNLIQHFTQRDGLTSDDVMAELEDREGNVWVVTRRGLDRFRSRNVVPGGFLYGKLRFDLALLADRKETVWAGNKGQPLLQIQGDNISSNNRIRDVTCAYRESDGTFSFGGTGTLSRMAGLALMGPAGVVLCAH